MMTREMYVDMVYAALDAGALTDPSFEGCLRRAMPSLAAEEMARLADTLGELVALRGDETLDRVERVEACRDALSIVATMIDYREV